MNKFSVAWKGQFAAWVSGILKYVIFVSLSIVLIFAIGKFAFNSTSRQSKRARTQQVAMKAYQQYTQKLDIISRRYAQELEATEEIN
jgi:hypothetical protein